MPEICRFLGAIITMNFKEHNPPHFHVTYGEDEATIGINALKHRVELLENRNLAQSHKLPKKIKPLE